MWKYFGNYHHNLLHLNVHVRGACSRTSHIMSWSLPTNKYALSDQIYGVLNKTLGSLPYECESVYQTMLAGIVLCMCLTYSDVFRRMRYSLPGILQWRHDEHDCLLNRLFKPSSKIKSKLRVSGLCERNLPVSGGFRSQRASNAGNVSIDDVIMDNRTTNCLLSISHALSIRNWKLKFIPSLTLLDYGGG